jgi:membrane protease subunit (stomatin/prohibitin family)
LSRAFGNCAYRIADGNLIHTEISGTREACTAADLDGQLRPLIQQHISDASASSGVAFLDLAANQLEFAQALHQATAPAPGAVGVKPDEVMARRSKSSPTSKARASSRNKSSTRRRPSC